MKFRKNRVIYISLYIFMVALALGCAKKKIETKDIDYFRNHLNAEMDYSEMIHIFGKPDTDLGNGELHIYEYTFYDSTSVRIGYLDKIVYACVVDKNRNLVEDLL